MLRCADNSLYTGIAADIVKRIKQHLGVLAGGAKYTHSHRVISVSYTHLDVYKRQEWDVQPGNQWGEDELKGINLYTCQSCGGELIADENTGATNCPYCDNPVIDVYKRQASICRFRCGNG